MFKLSVTDISEGVVWWQPNFYYETTEPYPLDRVTLEVDMEPFILQHFDESRVLSVNADLLQLPSQCSLDKVCDEDVCTRGGEKFRKQI